MDEVEEEHRITPQLGAQEKPGGGLRQKIKKGLGGKKIKSSVLDMVEV